MSLISGIKTLVASPPKLLCNFPNIRLTEVRKLRYRKNSEIGKTRLGEFMQAYNSLHNTHVGRKLFKSVCFTAGFTVCAFSASAIYRYEKIQKQMRFTRAWASDLWQQFGAPQYERSQQIVINLPKGEILFWAICGVNLVVWLCWKMPVVQRHMVQYFTTSPASKSSCLSLFFSSFSHTSLLHLTLNMYVLKSLCNHQMAWEQQLALYCSGGVVAACVSNLSKAARGIIAPSVGASGAIIALLGYFCATNPDARLSIVFIPQYSFSAESALKFMIGLDSIGLLLGWRVIDHACHLGGVFFGIGFAHYSGFIVDKQRQVVRWWVKLKENLND